MYNKFNLLDNNNNNNNKERDKRNNKDKSKDKDKDYYKRLLTPKPYRVRQIFIIIDYSTYTNYIDTLSNSYYLNIKKYKGTTKEDLE